LQRSRDGRGINGALQPSVFDEQHAAIRHQSDHGDQSDQRHGDQQDSLSTFRAFEHLAQHTRS